ncbi:MAG: hypothetical protein OFPII_07720 [Osedax symbiont Rs1]|nr:MAG: hypothetical protein OFPII_07720 [Osedax symbiont Rs1]
MNVFLSYKQKFLTCSLLVLLSTPVLAMKVHQHMSQEISVGSLIPTLVLKAKVDAVSGLNLILNTQKIIIGYPRENIQAEYIDGKLLLNGHAHLFINGNKIQRIYGAYVHVPNSLLKEGDNLLQVTLNSHRHENILVNGKIISSTVKATVVEGRVIQIKSID